MSYDVSIVDDSGNVMKCDLSHMFRGGKIRVDADLNQISIRDAEINITYNYCEQFEKVWETGSLFVIQGKKAKDVIPLLEKGVDILGTESIDDYYTSTPGNAGKALEDLLFLCEQCPEGIIDIC